MKKFIVSILFLLLMFSMFSTASASQVGDIIGNAVYTDIIASINDYNIESYNIDGYTAVVAEDLRNYGFDVIWNNNERALYITRGSTNHVDSQYIAPTIQSSQIGKKVHNVLYTDIKTYINGKQVTSYNIGGKTIVYFDDLSVFGNIDYNDTRRRLDLEINDGLNYKISAPYSHTQFTPSGLYFKINSADGLQIRWTATSNANKTINYYTTRYYMFNSVGDFAYDRWGDNYFEIKTIGPIGDGEMILNYTGEYEGEVYDAPVASVILYSIYLEYADGTSETIYYNHAGSEASGKFVL